MQAIMERLNRSKDMDGKMFAIRNGKMFVRTGYQPKADFGYLTKLYSILESSLIEDLKVNANVTEKTVNAEGEEVETSRPKVVKIPDYLTVAVPTSEKNFLGNYPLGTSIQMAAANNVIGIYWRNEWSDEGDFVDLDLHYTSDSGISFGWCYKYNSNGDIIFSGDMTNADPEAAELFYLKNTGKDGIVLINNYNGGETKFKLFVATEKIDNMKYGYMVNPNNIKFQSEITLGECGEKKIASINDGKIILMDFGAGCRRVSNAAANEVIQNQMKVRAKSYIDIKPLLIRAGYTIVEDGDCDLDFGNLTKTDLISLLSN